MRAFFIGLLLIAAAVGLALAARFNEGNLVIFFPPYRVDLSLNLFLLLMGLSFVLLYGALRLISKTFSLPQRVAAYRERQREIRANLALRQALQAYFEGRFGQSEKYARQAADQPDTSALAALIAARATHRMNEFARRDEWFTHAAAHESARAARLMTQAECLVDARDGHGALEVIGQLHAAGARHIHSLRLAMKAHQYAGDWLEVLRLLRALNKRDALHPVAARQIRIDAWRALLAGREDSEALYQIWQEVPLTDRRVPEIAVAMARAFNRAGLPGQARRVIEGALAENWDARLVMEYAQCVEVDSMPQIERGERWLHNHPDDPALNYALGVLCARASLWGKAQHYLGKAIAARDADITRAALRESGLVYEAVGDHAEAARQFRAAALG